MTSPIFLAKSGTPEWHEARKLGIGASEAAIAAGLSPYQTPLELYLRKRGEIGDVEDNDAMRMGRLLETVVKAEYIHHTGVRLENPDPGLFRHPEHSCILATPDGVVTPAKGLEAKTTSWRMKKLWGQEGTDEAPQEYVCQTQFQMAVMGFSEVDLAVLFDGAVFKLFNCQRNDRLIALLISAAIELWERIQDGRPPEPNWEHSSTPELIREMYGTVQDTRVMLSDNACNWWAEYDRLGKTIKEAEDRRKEARAHVLYEIGNHYAGVLQDGRMVRRMISTVAEHTVKTFEKLDVRAVKYDGKPVLPAIVREDTSVIDAEFTVTEDPK